MNNEFISYFKIQKSVKVLLWTSGFLFFLGIIMLIFLFYPLVIKIPSQAFNVNCSFLEPKDPIASLALGPLALSQNENEIPLPDIEDNINLISMNDRPDFKGEDNLFLLSIKGSPQKRAVKLGERVYLSFKEMGKNILKFDRVPSPIWIKIAGEGCALKLEVGIDVLSEEGEHLIESRKDVKLALHQKIFSISEIEDLALLSFVDYLSHFQAYPPDCLYELYAKEGRERGKYRLKQSQNHSTLYIEPGHFLPYHSKDDGLLPIARVEEITPSQILVKAWDRSGLEKCIICIPIEKSSPLEFKPEDVFKRLRKRTMTTVSCLLGAKKTQLKVGDWALHTKLGWKVIRSQSDIQDCLEQKIEGELFVFDGVKKENGRYYFQGSLFDKTRSEILKVSLPIAEGKTKFMKENAPVLDDSKDLLNESDFANHSGVAIQDPLLDFDYFDFDF